jgi:hypothetical protein
MRFREAHVEFSKSRNQAHQFLSPEGADNPHLPLWVHFVYLATFFIRHELGDTKQLIKASSEEVTEYRRPVTL